MNIILLSDLHIEPYSTPDNTLWVDRFCKHITSHQVDSVLIFVLGDIISGGQESAFRAADNIFAYMEKRLECVPIQFVFLPGNHDYCAGSLNAFTEFCTEHQTSKVETLNFTDKHIWNLTVDQFNFLLVDSIQDGRYNAPGKLDIECINSCLIPGKQNILLMHHSLLFEDMENHTGIVEYTTAVEFFKENKIKFIFHGHTHAERNFFADGYKMFGVGPIGMAETVENENGQFMEVILHGGTVETVINWLWRGGEGKYLGQRIYPDLDKKYGSPMDIPRIQFKFPDNYIPRKVLDRNVAMMDSITRIFSKAESKSLYEVCMEHQYVLLIADAGMGKTVELENLAFVSNGNPYLRPILVPLNVYAGDDLEEYIFEFAPEYKSLDPNQFFIILDGYDELRDIGVFKQKLNRYMSQYPSVRICISMRSNFLQSNSYALEQFSVFQLLELDIPDINSELRKHGIDCKQFYEECHHKGLSELVENPFYLAKIIFIYLKDTKLPTKNMLIKRFLDDIITCDEKKYEYKETAADDHSHEIVHALTLFAYGLQLMGKNYYSDADFNTIFYHLRKEKQYVNHSGLTIKTNRGRTFQHNIFKEYLVGKYIAQQEPKEIIRTISVPEMEALNPVWFNTLGFILMENQSSELISWVLRVEPLAITKMESDCITPELRNQVFAITLESVAENNIWYRGEVCSEDELAQFSQSAESLNLILEQIRHSVGFRSLRFCLKVLSAYTSTFGKENDIRMALVQCYQSDATHPEEKRWAISALGTLGIYNEEITTDLMSRFGNSQSSYERLGVYEYLNYSGQLDANVRVLLDGIPYLGYNGGYSKVADGAERHTLLKCLERISAPEAIEKIIDWLGTGNNISYDFYGRNKIIATIFEKATEIYLSGYVSVYDVVWKFYSNQLPYCESHHITNAITFFAKTNTAEKTFKQLVLGKSGWTILAIEAMIKQVPSLLNLFCTMYQENKVADENLFYNFTIRSQYNDEIFKKCSVLVYKKTKKEIVLPIKRDYQAERVQGAQQFFDSLFDKRTFQTYINQFLKLYSRPDMSFSELRELKFKDDADINRMCILQKTLYHTRFTDEHISDFVTLVKNWDAFIVGRVYYLSKSEDIMKDISINCEQKIKLAILCDAIEKQINYHTVFSERGEQNIIISIDYEFYTTLKKILNSDFPKAYYVGLLELPCSIVDACANVENKYATIEKQLRRDEIIEQIKLLLPVEQRVAVLDDLFFGCKKYGISDFENMAITFCRNSRVAAYHRTNALEYLYEMFGMDPILDCVVPEIDDELFERIVALLHKTRDARLIAEMIARCKTKANNYLMKYLIAMNVHEGLELYLEDATQKAGIPDQNSSANEITEAISLISDPTLLPLLVSTTKIRFSDGFEDEGFHTLYSSLYHAFSNCAKNDFEKTMKAIHQLKEELACCSEALSFCKMVEQEVIQENKMSLVRKCSPSQAKVILESMEVYT